MIKLYAVTCKVDDTQALLLRTLSALAADIWSPSGPAGVFAAREVEVHDMVEDPFLKASALFRADSVVEKYALSGENLPSSCASNENDELIAHERDISSCTCQPVKKKKCE